MGRLQRPALEVGGHTVRALGAVALLRLKLCHPAKHGVLQAQGEAPDSQAALRITQLQLPDPGVVRQAQSLSFGQGPALPIFFTQVGREDTPIGQNQGDFVELQHRVQVNQNPGCRVFIGLQPRLHFCLPLVRHDRTPRCRRKY
jgi:hypothetical protein